jgi:hypothetical protein
VSEVRRDGSRTIALLLPFVHEGLTVEAITFKAPVLETTLRWQDGSIDGVLALMSELSGLSVAALGQLRYPDADLVMDHFMAHVPRPISASIAEGKIPIYTPPEALRPRVGEAPVGDGADAEPWVGLAPPEQDALYDPNSPTAKEGDKMVAEFRRRQLETLGPDAKIVSGYGGFEGLSPDGQ